MCLLKDYRIILSYKKFIARVESTALYRSFLENNRTAIYI